MIKRYFIKPDGRVDSECFVDNPVNPDNWELFECEELPNPPHEYRKEGNNLIHDPVQKTPEEILAEKKRQRQAIVDAITVTTSTGKVFDGNEDAQSRMSRAIQAAQIASIPSTTWVLANNVPTVVTLTELQEALVLSMQSMGAVWAMPYED